MQTTQLAALAAQCRINILSMIQAAGSGHPGGALSTIDMLCALYASMNDGDHVVVSHGHTSAAVYAVLAAFGYIDAEEVIRSFRRDGSPYEGHPSLRVPGVEWCSGALGQGLSIGAGMAAGEQLLQSGRHTWVLMGDGEQDKGQIQEARTLAAKYKLGGLTALVDLNGLQASGTTDAIFPTHVADLYRLAGWNVMDVTDGHDLDALQQAIAAARAMTERPTAIIAHTIMGKGVPEIENNYEYHGKLLATDVFQRAVEQLNIAAQGAPILPRRQCTPLTDKPMSAVTVHNMPALTPSSKPADCRGAFGATLAALATANPGAMAAVDCDLAASVKLDAFAKTSAASFFECGIAETNAASFAAGLSRIIPQTYYADFGVFALTEVLSQLRMADFNHTALKVIATHCGADVGEDGKTHQATDYLALAHTLPSFLTLIPADANQCMHMTQFLSTWQGNAILAMGRSKVAPIFRQDAPDRLFFDETYRFALDKADVLRASKTDRLTIITYGTLAPQAVQLADALAAEGVRIRVLSIGTPFHLDEEAILCAAKETNGIIVWEDHNRETGLGTTLATFLLEHGCTCAYRRFGLSKTGISASPAKQYAYQGIAPEDIRTAILEMI